MTNDRITQDEFLKGVQKQRSLIRKLLAGERRRTEVLTELARQRYGWMIGKFFNAGSDSWWHVSQDSICCINDIKASAKNVFNDEVHLHMEYQVVEPRIEHGVMVNLNCHTETYYFNHDEDLEALMAQKWVSWEVADEQLFHRYEQMRQSYGLRKYDRLAIALDKIASLQAALAAKDEAHRAEMKGMIRWNGKAESRLHERLCKDYEQANRMIEWASRCDHPIESEGLIMVSESADSIISFIKKELGIIKGD